MKKIIALTAVLTVIPLLSACSQYTKAPTVEPSPVVTPPMVSEEPPKTIDESKSEDTTAQPLSKLCVEENGAWLSEYGECEGISKEACQKNKGKFSECESACRHLDESAPCTLQCVTVCTR